MEKKPAYMTVHKRLRVQRGHARDNACAHCGAPARDWALTGEPKWFDPRPYTDDLDAYTPLCVPCHTRLDRGLPPCPHGPERNRLPNGSCRDCNNVRRRERRKDPEFRDAANERSRTRYANDPEYREKIKAARRRAYLERTGQLDTDGPDALEF